MLRAALACAGAALVGAGPCGCVLPFNCAEPSCTPAVIVDQTTRSRSDLAEAVRRVAHAREIKLTDDALMIAPSLVLERTPRRDEHGLLLNGRESGKPIVFRLYRQQDLCVLVHTQSGRHWTLKHTHCISVAQLSTELSFGSI